MTNIPIFLSSDNNYAPFVATTIASVCNNTKSFCDFYILDGGISEENKAKICKLKNLFSNFSIEFIKIDTDKYFKNFIVESYITVTTYYRFLIASMFSDLDKVLYLDVDIIAQGDISDLYNIDLGNYVLGAVIDQENKLRISKLKKNLNMDIFSHYFNAGVLLIDLKKWQENNITQKLFKIEKKYRGNLLCNDQDVLNKVFENNYKILPQKFNALIVKEDTVIRHYYSKPKPWEIKQGIKNSNQLLSDIELFWYYAKKTPYYEQLCADCTYKSDHQFQLLKSYKKLRNKEMSFPKVSVIIPVYNVEAYLRKCLDSIVNQTLRDIEIICVNDCSPDNCLDILKEYAQNDNRIKIIDFKENKGVAVARNTAIAQAEGKYIGFVDSDDWIDLDFYEKLYQTAIEGNLDLVATACNRIKHDGRIIHFDNEILKGKYQILFSWQIIVKKDILQKHHLKYDESCLHQSEDTLFLIKALYYSEKYRFINNTCYNYLERNNSKTSTTYPPDVIRCVKNIFKFANEKDIAKADYLDLIDTYFYELIGEMLVKLPIFKEYTLTSDIINIYNDIKYQEHTSSDFQAVIDSLNSRNEDSFKLAIKQYQKAKLVKKLAKIKKAYMKNYKQNN